MSRAQRTYLAGLALVRMLDRSGLVMTEAVRRELYRRLDGWVWSAHEQGVGS